MYQVPFYVQRYSSNKTDSTLLQSPGDSIQLGPADHSLRFKIHFPPFQRNPSITHPWETLLQEKILRSSEEEFVSCPWIDSLQVRVLWIPWNLWVWMCEHFLRERVHRIHKLLKRISYPTKFKYHTWGYMYGGKQFLTQTFNKHRCLWGRSERTGNSLSVSSDHVPHWHCQLRRVSRQEPVTPIAIRGILTDELPSEGMLHVPNGLEKLP